MTAPSTTALYAGLSALLLVVLSARVIAVRRELRIALGDGEDQRLALRIRAHANFIEYTPIALLLILLAELLGTAGWLIHALGLTLLFGRSTHAWSMASGDLRARLAGMASTFAVLIAGAGCCLYGAFVRG